MRIAMLDVDDWNIVEQVEKIEEEKEELFDEVLTDEQHKEWILAEGFDLVQSVFTLFKMLGISPEEIKSHYSFHLQKLELRHATHKIRIEDYIEL